MELNVYLYACSQSYGVGCFMNEVSSMHSKNVNTEDLPTVGSIYQLHWTNVSMNKNNPTSLGKLETD